MIITRKYAGDKTIEGNYSAIPVIGLPKRTILNSAMVCDIITFDYNRKGTSQPGMDHDYRPQLLILGSNSMKYTGARRMKDRITGINLHYATQAETNKVINITKNMFENRLSSPQIITNTLMKTKINYRQYLIKNIGRIYSLYSLIDLENVQQELEKEGSLEDYQEEQNQEILARVNRNDKITSVPDTLLENLGFDESDIYK